MNRKGQYLTVEQLLIFVMGIFVLISVAIAYNLDQENTKKITVDDQFREVADLTLNNVIYVYNSGKNQNLSNEILFNIPDTLSAQPYSINLTQDQIVVTSGETPSLNITIPVSLINKSVTLTGIAHSGRGRAKINYDLNSNSIILRDV